MTFAASIELKDVNFSYAEGGHGVLHVNLSVAPGECVVLMGVSGCGKSTLTRLVNGLAPAFYHGVLEGQLRVCGQEVGRLSSWEIAAAVGSVFQDPKSQFFSSELQGEVAFASENLGLDVAEIRKLTDAAIAQFDLAHLIDRPLDVLSSGEAQRVAIASVCAVHPGVLVLDEPTANLDEAGIAQLRATLMQLKGRGFTLLVAEHRLAWLAGMADRYVLLQDGCIEGEYTFDELERMGDAQRTHLGLRAICEAPTDGPLGASGVSECGLSGAGARDMGGQAPTGQTLEERAPAGEQAPTGQPSLACRGLACLRGKRLIWHDVSLDFYPGDVSALTGKNGIGKTTLGLVLAGLLKQSAGSVEIQGIHSVKPAQRRRAVWFCSNNTATQFFTTSLEEELLLGTVPDEAAIQNIRGMLKRLGLYELRTSHPATLSGGQRQRLAVACALLSGRPIVIFDEPTSGLDANNMRIVAQELQDAAHSGRTIVVVTHDQEFMDACCTSRIDLSDNASNA